MTIEQYVAWLRDQGACQGAVEWSAKRADFAACWRECDAPQWMLWLLDHLNVLDRARNRKFACRCVRETPLADGRKVWDLLTDARSRAAVECAERHAEGQATDEELAAAWAAAVAAWAAARAAGAAAGDAAWAAAAGGAQLDIIREMWPVEEVEQALDNRSNT